MPMWVYRAIGSAVFCVAIALCMLMEAWHGSQFGTAVGGNVCLQSGQQGKRVGSMSSLGEGAVMPTWCWDSQQPCCPLHLVTLCSSLSSRS